MAGNTEVSEQVEEIRLDRSIKELVARVVSGTATDQEKADLQHLVEARAKTMRSPVFIHMRRLRSRVRQCA